MQIGPLTFLEPAVLIGLLVLPIIWWILRITPPRPLDQSFPPLRLLLGMPQDEEVPKNTPPWLLLYRLFMGALLAIALAQPILYRAEHSASGPVVLVVDNGWAAAANWSAVEREAELILKRAVSNNLNVAIVPTLSPDDAPIVKFEPAAQALNTLKTIQPLPYATRRDVAAASLKTLDLSGADLLWLSDGLEYGQSQAIREVVRAAQSVSLYTPAGEYTPMIAGEIAETANGFRMEWHRLDSASSRTLAVLAIGARGQVLAREDLLLTPGSQSAEVSFFMPAQLRNQIAQIRLEGYSSAATTVLLDDSWGRPLIGLLKGSDENVQPLLSDWYYIEKALAPSADIFKGDVDELTAVSPPIIFMADRARTTQDKLAQYVEDGGLLVRFAGENLAKRPDDLIPVPLRFGDREIGGALAWETPKGLAPFSTESPFVGLSVREDIRVKKQVMAQPGAATDNNTWARLEDGAPIITSGKRGLGRIILFHVTAGPEWSDLPMSGLYVDILKRILPLSRPRNINTDDSKSVGDFTPERTLNAYGQLGTPPLNAVPVAADAFATLTPSPLHPPGLYRQGARRLALNTVKPDFALNALTLNGAKQVVYGTKSEHSLSGILLAIVGVMLAFDVLLSLLASGRLNLRSRPMATKAGIIGMALFLLAAPDVHAQDKDHQDALELRLAYVITGDDRIDRMSAAGLEGLVSELTRRTTIEPGGVRGLDLETDTLDYYPFLYWPVMRTQQPLSDSVAEKVNQYMAVGGTLLLDTQDTGRAKLLGDETHPGLATLSESLDIPRLTHPSPDHVITKSFYLLQQFPGRFADGKIWVQADTRGTARDGVSSVILGGNDWAGAWAKDQKGRTITVIENEIPRQREMAYRFGVNVAMYTLAGSYKGDQVHAATLVRRLGGQNIETPGRDEP